MKYLTSTYLFILLPFLFYACGNFPDVGESYILQVDGSGYTVLTDSSNSLVVDGQVLNVESDSVFILLIQKPLDQICECNYDCLKEKYPNVNDLPTYKMCKEKFEKSTLRQYWIIDKSGTKNINSNVYGPYSKSEYDIKRQELGVPPGLKINGEKF